MYDASGRIQRDVHAVDDLKIARDARVALEKLKLGEALSHFRSRRPNAAMDPELTAEKLTKANILAQKFESKQRISAKSDRSTRRLLEEDEGKSGSSSSMNRAGVVNIWHIELMALTFSRI
mmetsp:Transcript_8307/g.37124  ORF Transcript_8307/g.37124 Transcript_8307/m.37124 type:complete len:121 (-) Transcript_8307:1470-1832(-)